MMLTFENLDVWKEATVLATDIYLISKDGDLGKDFGLRDQLRRSAVSIASNIADLHCKTGRIFKGTRISDSQQES